MCMSCCTLSIAVMALPRAALGARLKETVTAGNCPWWLMDSASVARWKWVNVLRGTALLIVELVELRVHRIDLALSQSVVQCVVDGRRCDAETRGRDTIDDQRDREPSRLLVGGDILELGQGFQFRDKAIGPVVQFVRIR